MSVYVSEHNRRNVDGEYVIAARLPREPDPTGPLRTGTREENVRVGQEAHAGDETDSNVKPAVGNGP